MISQTFLNLFLREEYIPLSIYILSAQQVSVWAVTFYSRYINKRGVSSKTGQCKSFHFCSMKHFSVLIYAQYFEEQKIFQSPDPFNHFYWDTHAYPVPITVNCDLDTVYQELNWSHHPTSEARHLIANSNTQLKIKKNPQLSHVPDVL